MARTTPTNEVRDKVLAVTFNRTGDVVASAGNDGTVRLWDIRNSQPKVWFAIRYPVMSAAFNPAGDRLIAGLADGTVHTFDGRTLQPLGAAFGAHAHEVHSLTYSPDGNRMLPAEEITLCAYGTRRRTRQSVIRWLDITVVCPPL